MYESFSREDDMSVKVNNETCDTTDEIIISAARGYVKTLLVERPHRTSSALMEAAEVEAAIERWENA
jgi:hypothetical protein